MKLIGYLEYEPKLVGLWKLEEEDYYDENGNLREMVDDYGAFFTSTLSDENKLWWGYLVLDPRDKEYAIAISESDEKYLNDKASEFLKIKFY